MPAAYRAKFSVTDDQGRIFSKELLFVVNSAEQVDQLFGSIWSGMNAALAANDVTTALGFLTPQAKVKYERAFKTLSSSMQTLRGGYNGNPVGELTVMETVTDENGRN